MQMKSMADELYARTDCRCISLEVRFHRTNLETLKAGALYLVQHIMELTKDTMVTSWNYEERSISEEKLPEAIARAKQHFSFCLEANVITTYVYNKKTLRDFSQTLRYDMELMNCERVSEDYWDCFDRHFAGCQSDKELQKALYELFQEPGRSNRGYYNGYDLECLWSSSPYRNHSELYYGSLGVKLGIGCVTGQEQELAERFAQWMKELCSIMGEANGLTGIVPAPSGWNMSPYMWYFSRCEEDEHHTHEKVNCAPMEWYPYFYLCGVEWRNVISPLTQSLLPQLMENIAAAPGVIQERLPGGGLLVGLEKNVLDVDVRDLLRLRELVDPALYPGESSSFNLWVTRKHDARGGPRGKWELVPIYPDEIVVQSGKLTFRKRPFGYSESMQSPRKAEDNKMTEAQWQSDWRNHGEAAYLMGKTLQYRVYHERPESHHAHCTFCWQRISVDMEGDERGGYVCSANGTEYWICRECFEELRAFFGWKVIPAQEEQGETE